MALLRYYLALEPCTVIQLGVDPDKSAQGHTAISPPCAPGPSCYALLLRTERVEQAKSRRKPSFLVVMLIPSTAHHHERPRSASRGHDDGQ